MTVRDKLFSEVEKLCKDSGLDFKTISQELSDFISEEDVVDYCITRGPLPSFPDTVFDIMILSDKLLCDYEITQQVAQQHMLPLKAIIAVLENIDKLDNEDYLSVHFRVSALGTGLVFQDKLTNKKNIRKFVSVLTKKIVEIT